MLKRNLMIIAVMALGLAFTGSAFGQEGRPPSVPPSKNLKKTGIKRPVIKTIKAEPKTSTVNRSRTSRTVRRAYKPKRPTQATDFLLEIEGVKSRKTPRQRRSTGKRMHKP